MEREAKIQDALKNLIESTAKKSRFEGLEITRVERDHPVDNREADIVLFMRGDNPFMFIETKREGKKYSKLFDPLDVSIVGQVMSYAEIYKREHNFVVPFVATANPNLIAVFKTPENIEDYIDRGAVLKRDYKNAFKPGKYSSILKNQMRGKCEKLVLNEGYIQTLLEKLAKEYFKKGIIKAEPTKALIGRFKGFVDMVAERCMPRVESKIKDEPLKTGVEKLGYKLDPDNLSLTVANLTRMMTYVLMNKIIFCKILERSYKLPKMTSLDSSSLAKFKEQLFYFFRRAVEVTGDFEPIFSTGVYDQLPIPDDPELMEYINDFISTLDSIEIAKMGEQIGYMYEELIPPEERHQFGQFYTPPWVCNLITKWCIREPGDTVLDPGVGSGGFLLQAYKVLMEEKVGSSVISLVRSDVHERILSQLYALDINPFPAHLSAMGLAIRNVKVPSTKMNVLLADFFSLQPGQEVLTPYVLKTPTGEQKRKFVIPKMDAVIGNPPYTRWTEIPRETQDLIKQRLGKLMKKYGLTPQVSRGVEPGIYTYWIMHATDFLEPYGRLGMIISNTWLQTDYGIRFGNFLLDNFRIKAIIDFAAKLFEGALITTCIVLAEKENDENKRLENEVAFIHIPGEVESADVEGLLKAVGTGSSQEYTVTLVKQEDLSRDKKWIDAFFKTVDIADHPLMTKLGELFEPSHGNVDYLFLVSTGKMRGVRNLGSSEFHYLSPSRIKEHELDKWSYPKLSLEDTFVYPALTSTRHASFFAFNQKDWEKLRKSDERCYMLICHRPKNKIPNEVLDYIRWGETECRAKGAARQIRGKGRLANETEAAKTRAKSKNFYGWYDVGGVIPNNIFAIRRAWRKTKFMWCKFPTGISGDAFIALLPKKNVSFDETQTEALLAYLNSNFAQYHVETIGLKSPGGIIQLDAGRARGIPVLDIRKLSTKQLKQLASLFDELERKAREIGGTSREEEIEKLKPKIYEIDRAVAALLGIKDEDVKNVEAQVDLMVERRVSVARRAS
jgi:type I restriction-modification system DNA methylase subunit